MSKKDQSTYVRFVLSQRLEHIVLMISFTMLCLTGLPQRYAAAGWAQGILRLLGGIATARLIHHFFAIVLLAQALYHVIVVLGELIGVRPRRWSMLPGLKDVRDGLASLGHLLGLRKERPRYARFDWKQKIEYWAMVWGTVAMGVTGLILMFPVFATRFLPGVLVPAAKVMHSYEAVLAFLAIITWHFYNAHLAAGPFPLDTSIFTGKISRERMMEEHPLEYEEWMADKGAAER